MDFYINRIKITKNIENKENNKRAVRQKNRILEL